MTFEHDKGRAGQDTIKPSNIRDESLADGSAPIVATRRKCFQRRRRVLSTDNFLEPALLTRKAEANLNLLEHTAKLSTQPWAPLHQRSAAPKSAAPNSYEPVPIY